MKMKKIIIFFVLFLMVITIVFIRDIFAYTRERRAEPNEVGISSKGVEIPLNRIILIHKGNQYCALKFTNAWIEMDEERLKAYADLKKGRILDDVDREAAMKSMLIMKVIPTRMVPLTLPMRVFNEKKEQLLYCLFADLSVPLFINPVMAVLNVAN
jgi:hypothetical protein